MNMNRRNFVAAAAAAGATAATLPLARANQAASQSVTLALIGANNRGSFLAKRFAAMDGVEFAYVCDPDERAVAKGVRASTKRRGRKPEGVKDLRVALDDPQVDGVVIATPNHWHAPATLMALAAGKHVYVEKPCSQNPDEGERMIAAAAASKKVVQVGTQRRSSPLYKEVINKVHGGAIGEVLYSKSWYHSVRKTIGFGKTTAPPAWLDYSLWQGPVEPQPYRDNLLHYNWHFFWHWGNGELGNNGIHTIDIARWAMDVTFPKKVTVAANKLRYEDDQQTPDTVTASYDFGDRMMVWEGIAWSGRYLTGSSVGIELRGTEGILFVDDAGYRLLDADRKVVEEVEGERGDLQHFVNYIDSIRGQSTPAANVVDGHQSAMYCHLGNIAYRTGSPLNIDPKDGRILDNPEAMTHWSRDYQPGWLPS